jgi:hypothetical protein
MRHQLSNVQLPMMLRTLIAAISSPEFQPLRECLRQLGQVLELPAGASAAAVAGALAAASLAPSSSAEAEAFLQSDAALAGALQEQELSQSPGSFSGVASASVAPSSLAGTAGSAPHNNSSSSGSPRGSHSPRGGRSPVVQDPLPPAAPYKDAVESEVVTIPFTSPIKVTGAVMGRKFGLHVDIGCTYSLMDEEFLRRNKHIFFYPGSPVQLLAFGQQAPNLGVMLGGQRMQARFVLRNVPLELGDGIYWVNFLVMPHSIFEVALGLEFVDAYAVQVSTKAYGRPGTGPQLMIPTPRSFCRQRVQESWAAGKPFHYNKVPGHFSISRERFSTVPVDPRTLSA